MKMFYLVGAIFFTVLILILAFENIGGACNYLQFFFASIDPQTSPTFLMFGTAFLGAITGALYFGFLTELLKNSDEEEVEE